MAEKDAVWIRAMLTDWEIGNRLKVDDVKRVYDSLIAVARKGENSHVYYERVAHIAGLNLNDPFDREIALGHLLGIISEHEKASGRPLLTAIVVTKETNMPGKGFWGFNEKNMDKNRFWIQEIRKVWEYWSKH